MSGGQIWVWVAELLLEILDFDFAGFQIGKKKNDAGFVYTGSLENGYCMWAG